MPTLTDAELKRRVERAELFVQWLRQGVFSSPTAMWRQLCIDLDLAESGWKDLRRQLEPHLRDSDIAIGEASCDNENVIDEPHPAETKLIELHAKLNSERAKVRKLVSELESARLANELADDILQRAADAPLSPWPVKYTRRGRPGTPILHLSDLHYGEVIDAATMRGINEYGPEIAADRFRLAIDKTIDIAFNHNTVPEYPNGIVVIFNGDLISGRLHDELKETDRPRHALEQAYDVIQLAAQGLRKLADEFGFVTAYFLPGNHDRNTMKMQHKGYVFDSYAYFIARIVADQFREDDRVSLIIPEDGEALFELQRHWFVAVHGDRMGSRGGNGFIGPVAAIARGMQLVRQRYAALGRPIDYCLTAHFHSACEVEWGFANGSLAGFSEYSKSGSFKPAPPEQWLLFAHDKYGISQRWKLQLGPKPRIAEAA